MPYWGGKPDDCDYASGAVGVYILLIKNRMMEDIAGVLKEEFPEQAIIVSLTCLRLLGEQFPKDLSVHFGKKDFAFVRGAFDEWYAKVSHRLPSKYRTQIVEEAHKEFALFEERILKRRS
jgi:hypothetical protein